MLAALRILEGSVNSEEALNWIISFLESREIPYLICGGLAAKAYGSQRPLHDIDLYVADRNYEAVAEFGHKYITYGPERLTDHNWNVEYVQFKYMGQKIEVGSSKDIQIFDAIKHEWHQEELDFEKYTEIDILGKSVRVMEKQTLIDYKRKLNREIDIADIEQIEDAQ